MLKLMTARSRDADRLAEISKSSFEYDIHFGALEPGGPPGYQSSDWQKKMMRRSDYYKILYQDQIIGGLIVMRKGPQHYELTRMFIEPGCQDQGFGTQVVEALWQEYPFTRRWTLDTPAWNKRTRHFYHKVGFEELGENAKGLVLFERRITGEISHQWE